MLPAEAFISHAWTYSFLTVLHALRLHFKHFPGTRLWFDVFTVNQHTNADKKSIWWLDTFGNAIKKINYTVLIADPWIKPVVFTRTWCVWEMLVTIESKSRLEIIMTPDQQNNLQLAVSAAPGIVKAIMEAVEVEKSEAGNTDDQEMILKLVQSRKGFATVNEIVRTKLLYVIERLVDEAALRIKREKAQKIVEAKAAGTFVPEHGQWS